MFQIWLLHFYGSLATSKCQKFLVVLSDLHTASVCEQKQEEQKPGTEPTDMEGETLINMVNKAVSAIMNRLHSELASLISRFACISLNYFCPFAVQFKDGPVHNSIILPFAVLQIFYRLLIYSTCTTIRIVLLKIDTWPSFGTRKVKAARERIGLCLCYHKTCLRVTEICNISLTCPVVKGQRTAFKISYLE